MSIIKDRDRIVIIVGSYFINRYHYKLGIVQTVADFRGKKNWFEHFPYTFTDEGESIRANRSDFMRAFRADDAEEIKVFIREQVSRAEEKVSTQKGLKTTRLRDQIKELTAKLESAERGEYECIYKDGLALMRAYIHESGFGFCEHDKPKGTATK